MATSATSATAAIQTGSVASISGNGEFFWDIDGDGTNDFRLLANTGQTTFPFSLASASVRFEGAGEEPGVVGSFAATAGFGMAYISNAAVVDGLFNFNSGFAAASSVANSFSTNPAVSYMGTFLSGNAPKTMGFRFIRNGGADGHYGVADFEYVVEAGLLGNTASINITNVFWNDVPY